MDSIGVRVMPHPYPFVPQKTFGAILKKGDAQFVVWMDDGSVDPAKEGSATEVELTELRGHVKTLNFINKSLGLSLSFGQSIQTLKQLGYEDLGARRFDFSSGILYGYSRALAIMCREAHDSRELLLKSNDGQHPEMGSDDWPIWTSVTMTMGACATGSRMLGIAAIEALLNEILAVRFPDAYDELEGKRSGWPAKAKKLYELLGQTDPPWLHDLLEENILRKSIAHHKPVYVDDFTPGHSVEASPRTSAEGIEAFLQAVETAFEDIFGQFGLDVPVTHLPGFM